MEDKNKNNPLKKINMKTKIEAKFHKVIIMGDEGVGKSSMFAVMFLGYDPQDTFNLSWTNGKSSSTIEFGGKRLSIEDCGGQEQFKNEYFTSKKKEVFIGVDILVFVLTAKNQRRKNSDIDEKKDNINTFTEMNSDELEYLKKCLSALKEFSPKAKVYILVHKMDLIRQDFRQTFFNAKKNAIIRECEEYRNKIQCFSTSIWDESLYSAWKKIMKTFGINNENLKKCLESIREACNADEVAIFEKNTFLLFYSVSKEKEDNNDDEKLDKLSLSYKKMMKSALSIGNKGFDSFKFRSKEFTAYVEELTKNILILIISKQNRIDFDIFSTNIALSRKKFEELLLVPYN